MVLLDSIIWLYDQYRLSFGNVGFGGKWRMEHTIRIHVKYEVSIRHESIGIALHRQMMDKTLLWVFQKPFYPNRTFGCSKCLFKFTKFLNVNRWYNNADLGES